MGRKKYFRPVVESESVFEQTSLACTTTEDLPNAVVKVEASANLQITFAYWCDIDVSKGGNLDDGCDVAAFQSWCVVPLS